MMNLSQLTILAAGAAQQARAVLPGNPRAYEAYGRRYNQLLADAVKLLGGEIGDRFRPMRYDWSDFLFSMDNGARVFASQVLERITSLSQHLAVLSGGSLPELHLGPLKKITAAIEDYSLRAMVDELPARETDVQEVMQKMLAALDLPYTRERDSIGHGVTAYRPDFVVGDRAIAVEIKLCNRSGRSRDITDEIHADVGKARGRYEHLLFVVYDLGHIRDVKQFVSPWSGFEDVTVLVTKH